jgi:Domain of unknown function (DUF4350)
MKEKLYIFLALIVLIIVLIGLNAASFVQKEKVPDSEIFPNRSTYNSGATGTRAFYDLLAETGRKVTRWQEPTSALSFQDKNAPKTFVVIGSLKHEFDEDEINRLLLWVSTGGKLVVIDREPPPGLIKMTNWNIFTVRSQDVAFFDVDVYDQKQMTDQTNAAKPVQPSVYTKSVNAVQPSRFASSIRFERRAVDYSPKKQNGIGSGRGSGSAPTPRNTPTPRYDEDYYEEEDEPQTAAPTPSTQKSNKPTNQIDQPRIEVKTLPPKADGYTPQQNAPVIHLSNDKKNLLVDFPYGSGKIIHLTDPYIVSNSGIMLVDNAQLAVNLVASDGLIAFDEYHQGYGTNKNRLLAYFAGTPVVAIVLQLGLLVALIFYSQSRRFARALPEAEPSRLSKLEYVAAMAELQQRTKAFDLAIENIYTDFRRRVARSFGVDNFTTSRSDLARMIAERLPSEDAGEIDELLGKCEDVAYGAPTNKKEVLQLAGRLRELEEKLGLQRRKKRRQK